MRIKKRRVHKAILKKNCKEKREIIGRTEGIYPGCLIGLTDNGDKTTDVSFHHANGIRFSKPHTVTGSGDDLLPVLCEALGKGYITTSTTVERVRKAADVHPFTAMVQAAAALQGFKSDNDAGPQVTDDIRYFSIDLAE